MNVIIKRALRAVLPARLLTTVQSVRARNHQKHLLQEWGLDRAVHEFVSLRGRTVSNGPFVGMTYPPGSVFNRASIPFLLGTYELELHSVIEEAIAKRFERIIDIGCADGYYAVGLAMRTNATVYAFDCEPREREYCRQMALTNGVHQRVHVRSWCSGRELKSLATGRCLVISDCEGYERELFSPEVIAALKDCDVLMELHGEAGTVAFKRFESSHDAQIIPFTWAVKDYVPERWLKVAREVRPDNQVWAYLTPRRCDPC